MPGRGPAKLLVEVGGGCLMRLNDFQVRRSVFSHSILKNGIVCRLPDDSMRFVLSRARGHFISNVSVPDSVSNNLLFCTKTWLYGSPTDDRPVVEILHELLRCMEEIEGFATTKEFHSNKTNLVDAANQCSRVMERITERREMTSEAEWIAFLEKLRVVCECVEQMDPRHPRFHIWLRSTFVVKPF